ncbi:hypothetical protein MPH_01706 [Macrophomina phaseolina MS6]|uniref:Uncharacterized protein n=1 Tax=Macrophomina phaseolina (strain MS6) TaxID=1126212 RepID=K2REN7_MACPH|nr:hypothetical protein MPH_01706 [Macrophomina phaseolina MS6]
MPITVTEAAPSSARPNPSQGSAAPIPNPEIGSPHPLVPMPNSPCWASQAELEEDCHRSHFSLSLVTSGQERYRQIRSRGCQLRLSSDASKWDMARPGCTPAGRLQHLQGIPSPPRGLRCCSPGFDCPSLRPQCQASPPAAAQSHETPPARNRTHQCHRMGQRCRPCSYSYIREDVRR